MTRSSESALVQPLPSPGTPSGTPGKRTLTSALIPRPIIFRLASGDDLAANAEDALDRAAGSGGAPLRGDLRARFEASLGADLSGVRVHTGGDSVGAAAAVGARAYTVGNDIHFGAGQYQPDDPFGLHLIAHEVAHTRQQAQGETGRQHKLEVSSPGDAAEVEADRAADAMVAGAPAQVGAASGIGRVMREVLPSHEDEARRYWETQSDASELELTKIDSALSTTPAGAKRDELEARRRDIQEQHDNAKHNIGKMVSGDESERAAAVAAAQQARSAQKYDVKATPGPGGGKAWGGGVGYGNRDADLESANAKDPGAGMKRANSEVTLATATSVPKPMMNDVPVVDSKQVTGPAGTHASYEVRSGSGGDSSTQWDPSLGTYGGPPGSSPVVLNGPHTTVQAGKSATANAGIAGAEQGKWGSVSGNADGTATAYMGADASAKIDQNGMSAGANAGIGAEANVTGKADYRMPAYDVDGTPIDAGIGVGGTAGVSAAAGAGANASIGKDEAGVWVKAGAAVKAEAKVDVHGDVGPVSFKDETGVMAGAGAGVEGGIIYKDGKLTMGAKIYAALGYGGTESAVVTIDLKKARDQGMAVLRKAKQMGIAGAEAAFAAADTDGDGRLTLNDPAQAASDYMNDKAKDVDRGTDTVIDALDGDGDGRFSANDVRIRARQGVDKAEQLGKDGEKFVEKKAGEAYDKTKQLASDGVSYAEKQAGQMVQDMKDAPKKLEQGAKQVADGAKQAWQDGGQALKDGEKAATEGLKKGAQAVDDGLKRGEQAVHDAADRDGDGKIGMNDAVEGAKQGGRWVANQAIDQVKQTEQAVENTGKAINAAEKRIEDGAKRAYDAADLNQDGRVDEEDAAIAADRTAKKAGQLGEQALAKADELKQQAAKKAAELEQQAKQKLDAAKTKVVDTANQVKDDVKQTLDRDGDGSIGLNDAKEAANQLGEKAKQTANQIGDKAKEMKDDLVEQGTRAKDTLVKGVDKAEEQIGETADKVKKFTGLDGGEVHGEVAKVDMSGIGRAIEEAQRKKAEEAAQKAAAEQAAKQKAADDEKARAAAAAEEARKARQAAADQMTGLVNGARTAAMMSKGKCNLLAKNGQTPNPAATKSYSDGFRVYNEAESLRATFLGAVGDGNAQPDAIRAAGDAAVQRFNACIASFQQGDAAQAAG